MFEGFTPLEFEDFRGLITWLDEADVKKGYATDLLNCRFLPGAALSRSEVNAGLNASPGGDTYAFSGATRLNGLIQFIDNLANKTLIGLDSNGDIRKHAGGNWSTLLLQDAAVSGSMMRSVHLLNRVFHAFYRNALVEPSSPIRGYDGTNLDVLAPDGPGAEPAAADSATAGTIDAGDHQVAVMFEVRGGRYLTEPSPIKTWTAAGAKKVDVSSIPIGPSWVTGRRLIFTAANGQDWFFIEDSFRIPDNTTTSITIDFDDTTLQQAENYNKYFKNLRLPDFSGVGSYGSRLIAWGGLNTVKMRNLSFDGGFTGGVPLGWSAVGGGQAKGSANPYEGDYYVIQGDGSATRGEINQAEAATFIKENQAYKVNIRARLNQAFFGAATAQLEIDLFGTAVNTTGLVVLANTMTTEWVEYEAELTSGLATIPADLVLRAFSSGSMANGLDIEIDRIQIWPSNVKFEASTLRVSDPADERFDGVTGLIQVSKDDGQRIIGGLEQNAFFYVYKEKSAHAIRDDGQSTPNRWPQQRVSASVGLASPNALDAANDYHVIASRGGGYRVEGLAMTEITREIRTTWARINWNASHTIHTQLDEENKLVYFYVPLDADTEPNHCLVCDFGEGWGEDERKWNIDKYPTAIKIRSSAKIETSARKQDFFLGASNLAGNAQVFNYSATLDEGTAIQSYFETAYDKARAMVGGQDLFGGVAVSVSGSGTLLTTIKGFSGRTEVLANRTLASQVREYTMQAALEDDRAKIRFEVNGASDKFSIHRAVLYGMFWASARPA